jgi:hypothetical protein
VIVVLGVALTLLATCVAGRRTGLNHCAEHADIGRGLAGEDAARGVAGVSTVVVEANAADQPLHVRLAETGVGATGAGRGTVEALVYAAQQRVSIDARRLWMRLDHFSNCHLLSLPVRAALARLLGLRVCDERGEPIDCLRVVSGSRTSVLGAVLRQSRCPTTAPPMSVAAKDGASVLGPQPSPITLCNAESGRSTTPRQGDRGETFPVGSRTPPLRNSIAPGWIRTTDPTIMSCVPRCEGWVGTPQDAKESLHSGRVSGKRALSRPSVSQLVGPWWALQEAFAFPLGPEGRSTHATPAASRPMRRAPTGVDVKLPPA